MDRAEIGVSECLHGRRFIVANNDQGLSTADTVFHYFVDGEVIHGSYQGGKIKRGQQLGRITGPDTFELLYHCLTREGQMLAGWSRGTVGVDSAGRNTLSFVWGWLSGANGGGVSQYVELVE